MMIIEQLIQGLENKSGFFIEILSRWSLSFFIKHFQALLIYLHQQIQAK